MSRIFGRTVAVTLVAALWMVTGSARAQQCGGGRVATAATQGRCCWPGQHWDPQYGRCAGPPECPPGMLPAGDDCVAAGAGGAVTTTSALAARPAATRRVRRPIWGLAIPGIIGLGVGWVGAPIVAAALDSDGDVIATLAVPVAGPWICLGTCDPGESYVAALVVDGAIQLAGLTMLIVGLAVQRQVEVVAALDDGVELALAPWGVPSETPSAGLTVSLTAP
ncbi:MAG TPA: hypothetical protein RMH99_21005 [Sandaracinaceae bacterium LLY-WYZ-13_1]|nr:hypothetical protein [Sandaracinaceae bacterium LLY-WYZ-13_1]